MFDPSHPIAEVTEALTGHKAGGSFASVLGRIADAAIILSLVLLPIWFLPVTIDVVELNKQTLLLVLSLVALVAWIGKALLERSFTVTRSWLHLVALGFLGGYAVTSWFSSDRYLSFVGNVGQMQWSFLSVAAFVLLYFLIVNRFRSAGQVYDLILWFLLGSLLAGIYGLLQMGGVFLIAGVAASKGFNSIGTVNALGVFMVVPTVLAASLTVLGCREKTCILSHESWVGKFWHVVIWSTLVVGLLTAVAVDYWVVWAGLLFGDVLLVALPFLRTRRFGHPVTLIVPAVLALLSILLLLFRTPIDLKLPSEVSPSARHSWQIAQQALRDAPLFGTGPGTWLYDYAKYRSVDVNLSPLWNIRFERGLTAFLTLVAMLGVVGTALWILLLLSAVVKSGIHLVRERNDDLWQAYLTVFTGWITLVFLAFCYNYNMAHHASFWFLLALLGVLVTNGEWSWHQRTSPVLSTVLSVAFLVMAVGSLSAIWLAGQRLAAEWVYTRASNTFQAGQDLPASINGFKTAVSMNPLNPLYLHALSQAELAEVARILQQGSPDEAQSLRIRELLDSARMHARRATEISPPNVDGWANQASLYKAISGFTEGADQLAIDNYTEALKREPNNPAFMNEIGVLYLLRVDAYALQQQSPDAETRTKAEAEGKSALESAAQWFNRAISAKPDYAPAHFHLGLVYERQGRVKDAVAKLEQVLASNPQDTGVAFQLATLYVRADERDAGRSLFEQIIAAEPNQANARWLLAALYKEEGRYDDAIAQIDAIIALGFERPEITQELETLKTARDANTVPRANAPLPSPVSESIETPSAQPAVGP